MQAVLRVGSTRLAGTASRVFVKPLVSPCRPLTSEFKVRGSCLLYSPCQLFACSDSLQSSQQH